MDEVAAQIIVNYIEEYLFEPRRNWPKYWFNQRTYSRWAANEILELVMDNPLTPATVIIEAFMIKMLCFSYMVGNKEKSFIFEIAKDTAEEILHLFL